MPILKISLLALMIFGLIGILLAAATLLEQSKFAHAYQSNTTNSVSSGTDSSPQSETPIVRVATRHRSAPENSMSTRICFGSEPFCAGRRATPALL
jgi:hypothetical protein